MKRIYLHIGLHKTGTTAVQLFFCRNEEKIPNYHYPLSGRPDLPLPPHGHHKLPWSFLGRQGMDPDVVWGELCSEIDSVRADNIVLSSEEFDVLNPKEIALVRRYLSRYPVKVIVYLRRQDELSQAMYSTMVKVGNMSLTFDDFLKNIRKGLNHYTFLTRWACEFGKENMCVRIYAKKRLVENDAVMDFCEQVGIPSVRDLVLPNKNVNRGLPRNILEIMRRMKSLEMPADWIASIGVIAQRVYPDHQFYDIMDPGGAKRLAESFRSSNDKVLHEYLGDMYDSLFPESFDYMSEERWRELYAVPYGNIKKTIADLKMFISSCDETGPDE